MKTISCLRFCFAALLLLSGFGASAAPAPDRLQRVLDAGELRVCIWPDYYGITFRNPKTRQLSGIDIDLSAELGRELGVRVRYVDSSFAALVDNLLADRCDIAMHAVGITDARREKLAFTRPYLRSDIYAMTTRDGSAVKSWDDLDKPGRVIAVQAGTVMEPIMQRALRHAKLLVVRPPMTRENEVESGRADAFMADFPYSQRLLDMTDWARLVAPPQPFHLTDYAYALAPGDASLLTRVDRFIDAIRQDGRLQRAAHKHKLDSILIQGDGASERH